ncbi:Vacuolar protein sorting-associated protein 52 [Phlyctochytrium bullatum]|nr:Vacuolar protein sorting-associated protein 52 [Phlyctochytrium bullatum]
MNALDAERFDKLLGPINQSIFDISEKSSGDKSGPVDVEFNISFDEGLDLRKYAKDVEQQLKDLEKAHITDSSMETLLEGFQVDLDKISDEIQTLQNQSQNLNVKMKNRMICEGEVNEFFLSHLIDLNKKMTYVKAQKGKHIRALKDVGPELEHKIREFLLKKIESLKAPNTNVSIIQQILLKFKELYWFLLERYSEAAIEIKANYIVTASTYFFASFEKYLKSMSKVQAVIADKTDLIGAEESTKRGLFVSKSALKDRTNIFTLGDRIQILHTADPGIILAHIAEEQQLKFPFEVIFKSVNRLLMDNASSEYIFTTEFFFPPKKQLGSKLFEAGAINISSVFLDSFIKQYIENSFDAVGILISGTKKITRRYAEFAASVLTLNDGLLRLRNEVEHLLQRMASELHDDKSRITMLINNYDLVATILSEYPAVSLEGEKAYFEAILEGKIAEYVEEELKPVFGYLMEFVTRASLEKSVDTLDTDRFERIANEFNNSWKAGVSALQGTIGVAFPNFRNGERIFQAALAEMVVYYKRFMILWEKRFMGKGRRVHPVGIQTLMSELKKFKPNFQ